MIKLLHFVFQGIIVERVQSAFMGIGQEGMEMSVVGTICDAEGNW